jgi:phosphoadenosine phosphosulfate reductase
MKEKIEIWNKRFLNSPVPKVLEYFVGEFGNKICLSSSMGAEDQVLTDMLVKIVPDFRIITLDTGRLFPETLDLIHHTREYYRAKIEVFSPDYRKVETMVNKKGINLFYESIRNRKMCCNIRKVEPLKRALAGMSAWITGIRKEQTINRFNTRLVVWDETYGLIKINPLYRWTEKMVWKYISAHQVPYNKLHDNGFPSIGCQPCTRAIKPGEDTRAGRWWWEYKGPKECGLHTKA